MHDGASQILLRSISLAVYCFPSIRGKYVTFKPQTHTLQAYFFIETFAINLRTFALIFSAHPYCERIRIPRQQSNARAKY